MALKKSVFMMAAALTVLAEVGVDASPVRSAKLDFNGDGRSDLAVYDNGFWAVMSLDSKNPYWREKRLGTMASSPVPGFYAGSRVRMEAAAVGGFPQHAAVYNAGTWHMQDMDETFWKLQASFGFSGAVPVPGDYDGDGVTDLAVYSKGVWYIIQSSGRYRQINFGFDGGHPLVGDFNGDGKDDPVIVWVDPATRLMRWAVYVSSTEIRRFTFGGAGAIPVPGYHHNAENPAIAPTKMNPAVYHVDPITRKGAFYISKTGGADGKPIKLDIGTGSDIPVGGCDFDGDGKSDIAVYNGETGVWTLGMSRAGGRTVRFGYKGAKPVGASTFK